MRQKEPILATRLGLSVHVSPLRFRLLNLLASSADATAKCVEDWLVDVANRRGARVVYREDAPPDSWRPPSVRELPDEDLVVALCQLQCLDRPQMLRLAAQLVSRKTVDPVRLCATAERERAGVILAELARLALRVDKDHALWRFIAQRFGDRHPPREPLLHWTRLAEPIMKDGRCNAEGWRLVA